MSKHSAFRQTYESLPPQLLSNIEVISLNDTSAHGVYRGIWDTGASMTMITPKIFSDLKLTPIDTITVNGVNSCNQVPVVLINVVLPNGIKVYGLRATVSEIQGIDMLIGMDIIQLGDFSISNSEGKTVFTFAVPPFPNRMDLYEKSIAVSNRKKHR
jgi:predicted aspartyl protease